MVLCFVVTKKETLKHTADHEQRQGSPSSKSTWKTCDLWFYSFLLSQLSPFTYVISVRQQPTVQNKSSSCSSFLMYSSLPKDSAIFFVQVNAYKSNSVLSEKVTATLMTLRCSLRPQFHKLVFVQLVDRILSYKKKKNFFQTDVVAHSFSPST